MNISGVVVRTFPKDIDSVSRALVRLDGVEVYGASEDGRLVVIVEQTGERATADILAAVQNLPGVLYTSMIYHQFEDTGSEETAQ